MVQRFRNQEDVQPSIQMPETKGETILLPETTWADEELPSGIPPEDKVVVTISREFGSGGGEIGRLVATNSGLSYIDQHIIDEVARRSQVDTGRVAQQDERTGGLVGHMLEAIQASSPFTVNYSTLISQTSTLLQSRELDYLKLTQKVVLETATQGNTVIIGRGGQFLLHNAPRTLHIYIFAPLPHRIENVMKMHQLDHEPAKRLIEQHDFEHDSYLRRYYGNDGRQPGLYHLLINTGLFSFELAASLIQQTLPIIRQID